ncbi:hypothetical protein [Ottowia beijingensis]|uniref:hypothetical protein n=1 Tax=Ottowia beijingensis TaxID=1207057 RepID=UPI00214DE67A|nr:hypothetical protein [Ottowia beijingensis]
MRQALQGVDHRLQHAGGTHARVGHDQRPRDAHALALRRQLLHGAVVELDLGEVLDEGHGWISKVRCSGFIIQSNPQEIAT